MVLGENYTPSNINPKHSMPRTCFRMEAVRERMQIKSLPSTPSEKMPPSPQDLGVGVSPPALSEHKSTWTGDLPASIEGKVRVRLPQGSPTAGS